MGRGDTGLDSREYDHWLAKNKKEKELRERKEERRAANTGYTGWHFGLGDKPVHTKDKQEFIKELDKRGLAMKDGCRVVKLANGEKKVINER